MDSDCIDMPTEIDNLIDKVIEQAEMEDMVDYLDIRDDIIQNVGAHLYKLHDKRGMDEVILVVKKKLKVKL